MDFIDTVKGSMPDGFYPEGWDMEKIDKCCRISPEDVIKPESFWHKDFKPVRCDTLGEFDTLMGHEIALRIKKLRMRAKSLR